MHLYQRYLLQEELYDTSAPGKVMRAVDEMDGRMVIILQWNHTATREELRALSQLLGPGEGELFSLDDSIYLVLPEGSPGPVTLQKVQAANAFPGDWSRPAAPLPSPPPAAPSPLPVEPVDQAIPSATGMMSRTTAIPTPASLPGTVDQPIPSATGMLTRTQAVPPPPPPLPVMEAFVPIQVPPPPPPKHPIAVPMPPPPAPSAQPVAGKQAVSLMLAAGIVLLAVIGGAFFAWDKWRPREQTTAQSAVIPEPSRNVDATERTSEPGTAPAEVKPEPAAMAPPQEQTAAPASITEAPRSRPQVQARRTEPVATSITEPITRETPMVQPQAPPPNVVKREGPVQEPAQQPLRQARNEPAPKSIVAEQKPPEPTVQRKEVAAIPQPPKPVESGKSPAPQRAVVRPSVSSGSITWSGVLDKGVNVTIEDLRADKGEVHGVALPGLPVIVDVSPADIAIAEAPAASNGWKKIVLRSNRKRNIVVTLNWRLAQ